MGQGLHHQERQRGEILLSSKGWQRKATSLVPQQGIGKDRSRRKYQTGFEVGLKTARVIRKGFEKGENFWDRREETRAIQFEGQEKEEREEAKIQAIRLEGQEKEEREEAAIRAIKLEGQEVASDASRPQNLRSIRLLLYNKIRKRKKTRQGKPWRGRDEQLRVLVTQLLGFQLFLSL